MRPWCTDRQRECSVCRVPGGLGGVTLCRRQDCKPRLLPRLHFFARSLAMGANVGLLRVWRRRPCKLSTAVPAGPNSLASHTPQKMRFVWPLLFMAILSADSTGSQCISDVATCDTGIATRISTDPSACPISLNSCAYKCAAVYNITLSGTTMFLTPVAVPGCTCYTGNATNVVGFGNHLTTFQDRTGAVLTTGFNCRVFIGYTVGSNSFQCTDNYAMSGTSACPLATSPAIPLWSSPANLVKPAAALVTATVVSLFF